LTVSTSYSQTFEGWITYKLELMNPSPQMIPDSSWKQVVKESLGERGYMIQKYYYKKDKYMSEIDAGKKTGFQLYNTKDKLLYAWQVNSDTAVTIDSRQIKDSFVEIIDNPETETILGIACKSITVKSKMGQMKIWYNSDYFKMDAALYAGHLYGHWEPILKKIKCLPLKIEQKGFPARIIQTATAFKEEPVDDNKFTLPKFKTVLANPVQ